MIKNNKPIEQGAPSLERVWEVLLDNSLSLPSKYPNRREKIRLVFPESFCKEVFSRSPSYLSWFLHRTPQARPLMECLLMMFSENPSGFLKEMSGKCSAFLLEEDRQKTIAKALLTLLEEFGKCFPEEIGSGTSTRSFLDNLCQQAPDCALTVIFLLASTNEQFSDVWKRAILFWQATSGIKVSSPEDLYHYGLTLQKSGQKKKALETYMEILHYRDANEALLGKLYYTLGNIYRFGESVIKDEDRAISDFRNAVSLGNYAACAPLAELLFPDSPAEARSIFLLGANHGEKTCQYELGKAFLFGNRIADGVKDLEKAEAYLSAAAAEGKKLPFFSPEGDPGKPDFEIVRPGAYVTACGKTEGHCVAQYLLARLLLSDQSLERRSKGLFYLQMAASRDVADARRDLLHLYESKRLNRPEETAKDEQPLCVLTNSLSAEACHLLMTLTEEKKEILVCGKSLPHGDLFNTLPLTDARLTPDSPVSLCEKYLSQDTLPRIVILLLNEEKARNLTDCQALIAMFRRHLLDREGLSQEELARKVRIFLASDGGETDALAEVLMAQADPFFIPLCIHDSEKTAAELLLECFPLYLPLAASGKPTSLQAALIGSGPSLSWILRDALTLLGNPELPFNLSCIEEGKDLESGFSACCPAYLSEACEIPRTIPIFYDCEGAIETFLFQRESNISETAEKARESILRADYLIIDTGDDFRNLNLATQLGGEILRHNPNGIGLPTLAVCCRDTKVASLVEACGISQKKTPPLILYGSGSRLGDWEHVIEGHLEKKAVLLHRHILEAGKQEKPPCSGIDGLLSYYKHPYYRDSARMSALYSLYFLAENGIYWPSPEMHDAKANMSRIVDLLNMHLPDLNHHEAADEMRFGKMEHNRWCRFLLTRGWSQASPQQVVAYIEQGNPHPQLFPAKLHPLLCSFEELGDKDPVPVKMQAFYMYIWQKICPWKEAPNLKEIDQSVVHFLPELLQAGYEQEASWKEEKIFHSEKMKYRK